MKFTGYDGEIELEGAIIKIKKGKKDAGRTIRLSDVVSTTLLKPGLMMEIGRASCRERVSASV